MRNFRREVAAASESPVELPETEFSWSLTRHLRFLHCERGYFLHYYAAQGGWDRYADSVAAAVYRGKKTLLLPEWLEERMDQAWKSVLDRIRFLPEKMRQRAFRYRLERRLLEDLEEEAGRTPEGKHQGIVPLDIDVLQWNEQILKPADMKRDYVREALRSLLPET